MRSNFFQGFIIAVLFTSCCAAANAAEKLPESSFDGLELVSGSRFAAVYAEPGVDLSGYRRLKLDDAYVAFKKNFLDSKVTESVSPEDLDKIKVELMLMFREVFSRTLEDNGYTLTSELDDDVLQIKPAIINLDIVLAENPVGGGKVTYSESAGEMTLYLELYDSISGDIIARVIDHKQDRQAGYFLWENQLNNRAAAQRILRVWANTLKQGLDDAMGTN